MTKNFFNIPYTARLQNLQKGKNRAFVGFVGTSHRDIQENLSTVATTTTRKPAAKLTHLTPPANESTAPTADDESERESFEERAAIMEYDGNMTRTEAEEAARALMATTTAEGEPHAAIEAQPYPTPPEPGNTSQARPQAGAHPCPPLPSSYRFQGAGPLHRLRADPDDSRIRCAYCQWFKSQTKHGRLKPWCARFNEWRDPAILHQCDEFSFQAGALERWL